MFNLDTLSLFILALLWFTSAAAVFVRWLQTRDYVMWGLIVSFVLSGALYLLFTYNGYSGQLNFPYRYYSRFFLYSLNFSMIFLSWTRYNGLRKLQESHRKEIEELKSVLGLGDE